MAATERHSGACLCGAVRYQVKGEPSGGNICHCTQCRRQTGSPLPAFATYPLDRFELLAGEPAAYRASDFATRQFCPRCGSALFWRRDGGAELDIFLGSFDHPERLPRPAFQLWTQHRIPWVPELPEIRAYRRSRQEG